MSDRDRERDENAPDNLIRDIPLMQRISRRNEREDYQFRGYLKWHLNLSNTELDAAVREITDEVWSRMDCTECAHCCKTLQVEVNAADAARLAEHLGLSVREFSRRYVRSTKDNAKVLNALPCPFLGEDNRCTVYEDRPEACREYPFLHQKDFRSRSLLIVESTSVCPITFNVWQALKARFGRQKRKK